MSRREPPALSTLRIVPANEASWEDLQQIFGIRGYASVGWCAIEPRNAYDRLKRMPLPWKDRPAEDREDESVWAVTCFATRAGFRKRGISRALTKATVEYSRSRGARALEGYPMITHPGEDISWGETFVGSRGSFEAAGFREIGRPSLR